MFEERWPLYFPPGETLTGLEVITPHFTNFGADLRYIRPRIIKTRWARAGYLRALHDSCPDAVFVTRPESEGLNYNEIVQGYRDMETAMRAAQLVDYWAAHEISNEPNHHSHGLNPVQYASEAIRALNAIGNRIVPLGTGGYQRYNLVEQFVAEANNFPNIDWRGFHMYFQGDGPITGVIDGLAQIGKDDIRYSLCTEANAGHVWIGGETEEKRIPLALTAYRYMAKLGIPGIIHFALDSWSGGPEFAYTREGTLELMNSIPKPRSKKVAKYSFGGGFKEWVENNPDANVGKATGSEKWVKKDVLRIQTTEDGDGVPGALFWFVGDPIGTRFIKKGYPM